jgi:diguanylate cyclase (GGDEF)-like protein/PAS domain S-box-containing protein
MGEFSDAFNIMVQRLDQSRTSLEVLNLRLREDNIKLQNLADELREKEERLRHSAENVSDVIWTLDSSMEHFTYVSPSIASLRGLSVDEALREPLDQAMTSASLALLRNTLSARITDPENKGKADAIAEKIEVEQICRDGRIISVEVVITAIADAEGRLKEFVGVSRDITARKQIEDRLKYQSTHDALTGLHNRAFFDAELELTIRGRQFPVSVIVADLDGLKRVNDNLGHESGDRLIKGAAEIFRMAFRGDDIIARTGGDEFVMLLREMDQDGAATALDRIRSCAHTYNAKHGAPSVSISLGAATAEKGEDVPVALKEADERMYGDKVRRRQQRTDCL